MAGTKISAATTTSPVASDMIPFARVADAISRHMTISGLTTLLSTDLFDQALVFNEGGASVDFRFEGYSVWNLLFIDGSTDRIGIGTHTPTHKLHIECDSDVSLKIHATTGSGQTAGIILQRGNFETDSATDWKIINDSTGRLQINRYVSGAEYLNRFVIHGNCVGIGTYTPSAYADLTLADQGGLCIKETTTPTADSGFGKIYCKNTDKLYFQDGAGVEHILAFV